MARECPEYRGQSSQERKQHGYAFAVGRVLHIGLADEMLGLWEDGLYQCVVYRQLKCKNNYTNKPLFTLVNCKLVTDHSLLRLVA